jgi:hypothetical protein
MIGFGYFLWLSSVTLLSWLGVGFDFSKDWTMSLMPGLVSFQGLFLVVFQHAILALCPKKISVFFPRLGLAGSHGSSNL